MPLHCSAGFVNAVATLGTAMHGRSSYHITRYAQELFLVYDGDKAGLQAILRIAELCWQVNLELLVVPLPEGEDPASYLSKGGSFGKLIESACDIFSFFIARLGTDFSKKSLAEKVGAARKITELIARLDEPLKQEMLLQQASQVLGLSYQSLKNEVEQQGNALGPQVRPSSLVWTWPHLPPRKASQGGRP